MGKEAAPAAVAAFIRDQKQGDFAQRLVAGLVLHADLDPGEEILVQYGLPYAMHTNYFRIQRALQQAGLAFKEVCQTTHVLLRTVQLDNRVMLEFSGPRGGPADGDFVQYDGTL